MVTLRLKLKCNDSAYWQLKIARSKILPQALHANYWLLHQRHQAGPDHLQIVSGSPAEAVPHSFVSTWPFCKIAIQKKLAFMLCVWAKLRWQAMLSTVILIYFHRSAYGQDRCYFSRLDVLPCPSRNRAPDPDIKWVTFNASGIQP